MVYRDYNLKYELYSNALETQTTTSSSSLKLMNAQLLL